MEALSLSAPPHLSWHLLAPTTALGHFLLLATMGCSSQWPLRLLWLAVALGQHAPHPKGIGLAQELAEEGFYLHPTEEEEEGVLVLTQQSFDQALQKYQLLLVAFCAPWSELCRELAPEFAKAAATLKDEVPGLRLAKVDAMEERALRGEFQAAGFPTLKLFRDGKRHRPIDYRGERDAETLVKWLRQKARPSTLLLEDVESAVAFLEGHGVAAIGFFHDRREGPVQAFYEVADDDDTLDVAMALTDRPELFAEFHVTGEMVSFFRKKQPHDGSGDDHQELPRADLRVDPALGLDAADLSRFLAAQLLEPVTEFTRESQARIFQAKVPNHLLLFLPNKTFGSLRPELLRIFRDVAPAFRGQVLFVVADVAGDGADLLRFFGLRSDEVPALRFIHLESGRKHRLDPERLTGPTALQAFCQAALEGKVEPYLMSQEVPEDWDQRPVKTLVGKNFEQVAFDGSKEVFVKFYAPWCPHSKGMAGAWEELGEKYQEHKDILIAEMDAAANEVAELPIRAYPTLYYFPMGQERKMIEYRGPRDLESFSQFLDSKGRLPAQADTGLPKTDSEDPGENQASHPERREEL